MARAASKADEDVGGDAGVEDVKLKLEKLRGLGHVVDTEGHNFVYFKLETTGLDYHISQISACSDQDNSLSASFICSVNKDITLGQALSRFIKYLKSQPRRPVVLFGHRSKGVQCPRLLNALQACKLVDKFDKVVHGFVDILTLFREFNEDGKKHRLFTPYEEYKEQVMPPAHDAMNDVRALRKIVNGIFQRHFFTLKDVREYQCGRPNTRVTSWMQLEDKVVSRFICEKLHNSDLTVAYVRGVFQGNGENAVMELLKKKLNLQKNTIDKIVDFLHEEMPANP